jgi:hypothetical protein
MLAGRLRARMLPGRLPPVFFLGRRRRLRQTESALRAIGHRLRLRHLRGRRGKRHGGAKQK